MLSFMLTKPFERFQQRRRRILRKHRLVHHRTIFDHSNRSWQHQLLVLLDRFIETANAKLDDLLRELQAVVHGDVDAVSAGWTNLMSATSGTSTTRSKPILPRVSRITN